MSEMPCALEVLDHGEAETLGRVKNDMAERLLSLAADDVDDATVGECEVDMRHPDVD